jgi:hypothetical protein
MEASNASLVMHMHYHATRACCSASTAAAAESALACKARERQLAATQHVNAAANRATVASDRCAM